jgi:hypothetical protein
MRLKNTIGLGLALLSWVVQPVLAQAGLPECAVSTSDVASREMHH